MGYWYDVGIGGKIRSNNYMGLNSRYCEKSTRSWPPLMYAEAGLCGLWVDFEPSGMEGTMLMAPVLMMNNRA